ncbi:hypothetical protein M9458_004735, partial [Cirrhinus mrigala]
IQITPQVSREPSVHHTDKYAPALMLTRYHMTPEPLPRPQWKAFLWTHLSSTSLVAIGEPALGQQSTPLTLSQPTKVPATDLQ